MQRRILLLESEQGLERILTLLLKQANFQVSHCRRAETAYARLSSRTCLSGNEADLVIIDLVGKDCEGSRLLKKLRITGIVKPMILIAPYGCEEIFGDERNDDSTVLLHSPFEPADLIAGIDRATRKRSFRFDNGTSI